MPEQYAQPHKDGQLQHSEIHSRAFFYTSTNMDKKLLEILVCPLCKGPLHYDKDKAELWCRADKLAFPIRDEIPIMLEEEARPLTHEELNG